MKKTIVNIVMFMLPLVLLVGTVEWYLRGTEDTVWFNGLAKFCAKKPATYVFIGSSMTAYCVDPNLWLQLAYRPNGAPVSVYNLGQGYSTAAEYYFGLRHVVRVSPDALKGCTVLIEAREDLPKFESWRDMWFFPQLPRLLSMFIDVSDLARCLTITDSPSSAKCTLILSWFSSTYSHMSQARQILMLLIDNLTSGLNKASEDLGAHGGARNDAVSVRRTREVVIQESAESLKNQKPIVWEETVVRDTVRLVEDNGGKVVFFNLPISSHFRKPLNTVVRLSDRASFSKALTQWRCKLVSPTFAAKGDEDFPDLMHLRQSRRAEFTKALWKELATHAAEPASVQ